MKVRPHPKDSGGGNGGGARIPPPTAYGPPPNIPMPHINSLGPPPMLDKESFLNWQYLMESHINYASTQLWHIIVDGFAPHDPSNLTPREVVDEQLNVSALYLIQKAF